MVGAMVASCFGEPCIVARVGVVLEVVRIWLLVVFAVLVGTNELQAVSVRNTPAHATRKIFCPTASAQFTATIAQDIPCYDQPIDLTSAFVEVTDFGISKPFFDQ